MKLGKLPARPGAVKLKFGSYASLPIPPTSEKAINLNWQMLANDSVADWAVSPDGNVPIHHPYVMQQFQGSPLDTNAWFGTIDQFKKYGWQDATPPPIPVPAPVPVPSPIPEPEPTPTPISPTPPTPISKPIPKPTVRYSWFYRLLKWLKIIK